MNCNNSYHIESEQVQTCSLSLIKPTYQQGNYDKIITSCHRSQSSIPKHLINLNMKEYCSTGVKQSQCDLICFACRCVATRRAGAAAAARSTAAELRFKGRWIFYPLVMPRVGRRQSATAAAEPCSVALGSPLKTNNGLGNERTPSAMWCYVQQQKDLLLSIRLSRFWSFLQNFKLD